MATSGPWAVVGDELATTTRAATGLTCGTTYHFRVSARGDGTPYDAKWGAPSGTLAAGTPCVSASASGSDLFVGQSATLTATVTGAPGGVSYRWQKWTSGAWKNLAATSTTHSVSSATTSVGFFRFKVNYPSSGGTAASGVLGVRPNVPLPHIGLRRRDDLRRAVGPDGGRVDHGAVPVASLAARRGPGWRAAVRSTMKRPWTWAR